MALMPNCCGRLRHQLTKGSRAPVPQATSEQVSAKDDGIFVLQSISVPTQHNQAKWDAALAAARQNGLGEEDLQPLSFDRWSNGASDVLSLIHI